MYCYHFPICPDPIPFPTNPVVFASKTQIGVIRVEMMIEVRIHTDPETRQRHLPEYRV